MVEWGPHFSSWQHNSLAILAEKSSDKDRKIFVRKVCSKVRQVSPGRVDCNELMLCVATRGTHFAWRESEKNFSSPLGSFTTTEANSWYSSQMNTMGRQALPALFAIRGFRL